MPGSKRKRPRSRSRPAPPPPSLHPPSCQGQPADLELMQATLKEHPELLNQHRPFRRLPLASAVDCEHAECVRFLLRSGADVNATDAEGNSLVCAALLEHIGDLNRAILIQLLEAGLNVNLLVSTQLGQIPYFAMTTLILEENIIDRLELCFEYGANPNARVFPREFNYEMLILNLIITKCSSACVKLFLENGADPNALVHRQDLGRPMLPAICTAIMLGQAQTVKYLLLYNAKTEFGDLHPGLNETNCLDLLMCAEQPDMQVNIKILRLLHKFGCNIWSRRQLALVNVPEEEAEAFNTLLHELRSRPMSLMELSRIAVLHAMGRNFLSNLHKLEIPETLYSFLEFSELET